MKPQKRRRILRFFAVLFALGVADYLVYPLLPDPPAEISGQGQDGIWLRDSRYLGTEKESVRDLAFRLNRHRMRDAYFHVRFIQKDGALHFRQPKNAQILNTKFHKLAPFTRSIAWIYVGNERGLTGVDLGDAKVRKKMVQEAVWLSTVCGFDGVQWDYEICSNGDPDLLKLLDETRAALPSKKFLGIATPMWLPFPLGAWGWSEDYFSQVAARTDQIAVMAYDSAIYTPRFYVWLVREQAIRVGRAAQKGNSSCDVLIGLPTYEDGGPSHYSYAENLRMGLRGVRAAQKASAQFAGVAIFADYTTDKAEWEVYERLWD